MALPWFADTHRPADRRPRRKRHPLPPAGLPAPHAVLPQRRVATRGVAFASGREERGRFGVFICVFVTGVHLAFVSFNSDSSDAPLTLRSISCIIFTWSSLTTRHFLPKIAARVPFAAPLWQSSSLSSRPAVDSSLVPKWESRSSRTASTKTAISAYGCGRNTGMSAGTSSVTVTSALVSRQAAFGWLIAGFGGHVQLRHMRLP